MFHQHEKQLNALIDFSGKNNPREFSVNKFIREIRPASREQHRRHLNQEFMRKRETSLEGIALHCWQHQQEIFDTAYQAKKTDIHYPPTLDMNEVYAYVIDLFVDRTWVGFEKEFEAEQKLRPLLRPGFRITTDPGFDETYGVDLCIRDSEDHIVFAGQVKPTSYRCLPATHHNVQGDARKNERFSREYHLPVDYVYWDSKTREWEDWKQFLAIIRQRHQEYDALAASN